MGVQNKRATAILLNEKLDRFHLKTYYHGDSGWLPLLFLGHILSLKWTECGLARSAERFHNQLDPHLIHMWISAMFVIFLDFFILPQHVVVAAFPPSSSILSSSDPFFSPPSSSDLHDRSLLFSWQFFRHSSSEKLWFHSHLLDPFKHSCDTPKPTSFDSIWFYSMSSSHVV